ncbi:MAG: hypothetical protein E7437_05445 [Ruminococcaceae bacterium]|nr:hypothetical protein [Oscillospiraceae bacterium]
MKNKKHLYVNPKSPLIWLAILCLAGSAVTRVLFIGLKGADLWSQIVLPIAACLVFAGNLLFSGRERLYKTAIPIWLVCIYYAFHFSHYSYGGYQTMITVLFCLSMLLIASLYSLYISGKNALCWFVLPLIAAPLVAQGYLGRSALYAGEFTCLIPDGAMILGIELALLAIHVHTDGAYHATWGDRSDGRRVRTLPAMAQVSPYIMVDRQDASNLIADSIEVTGVERYIRQKRREGYTDFGILHVMLASYCRAVAKFPAINRFLSGQKVYSRGNDIQFCMVVKKEMTTEAPDTVIKVHLTPYDTAVDVYNKLNTEIEKVKNTSALDSSFDNTAGALTLIPGVFLKFAVWLLKTLDYFGLLPKFLLEVSPFHGSVFFTSMGSLGIPPIYHHLYNFGNLPVFCAIGRKRRVNEVQDDGTVITKKFVDLKITTDERIVDGFYYAAFFKHYKHVVTRPDGLDLPPTEVLKDID